jgi:hypothetical protein
LINNFTYKHFEGCPDNNLKDALKLSDLKVKMIKKTYSLYHEKFTNTLLYFPIQMANL